MKFLILFLVFGILNIFTSNLRADELNAYPASVVINAVQGHAQNDTRPIFIFTSEGSSMNWTLSKDASWLTTGSQSGVAEGILRIGANIDGMQPGVYPGEISLTSLKSNSGPVIISVTLIINPDVPVTASKWKDGQQASMSVSVDDSRFSGFEDLRNNGFSGTYFVWDTAPPPAYTDYYNAGMELGSHTINHPCFAVSDVRLRTWELEPSILSIITNTPEPYKDVISFSWPCGFTNYREEAVASQYFLSARGYNINQLEDATPDNFMNLKSYNSHEHTPFPPGDLKTVVDLAIAQKKWFNLVLHSLSNDDGAINYAVSKDIWVTSIGTVIKYILQRDRLLLTNYITNTNKIIFNVSRLSISQSTFRNFEEAFGQDDLTTLQIDIDDNKLISRVLIDGVISLYKIKVINGNKVLLLDVKLEPGINKAIEVELLDNNLIVTGVTVTEKIYDGTKFAVLNTENATLHGLAEGDKVALIPTHALGTFTDKNAGYNKTVTTSGFVLEGDDAGKYILVQPTITANINKAVLSVSNIIANNKIYDGTTVATLDKRTASLSGVLGGDNVNLISLSATGIFNNKNAGIGKIVAVTGFSLKGSDVDNYILIQPVLTANITAKSLRISAKDIVKSYGSTITFTGSEVFTVGLTENDSIPAIKLSSPGSIATARVGTYPISVEGESTNNYNITYVGGKLSVNKSILTVEADNKSKVYATDNPPLTVTYSGFLNREDASSLDALPVTETDAVINSDAGEYDINVSGASSLNYNIIYKKGILSINKADQAISFESIPKRLRITQESKLTAISTSGLSVSFESSDPEVGRLDGDILRVKRDGSVTVSASQSGDHNWNPAPVVAQTIETLPTFDAISSLFSPNNDGMNDYWYIPDLEHYGKLQVTVYNRFGQTVYNSDSYKNDWDGTWNGNPLPSASYYYVLRSSLKGIINGVVNIVR